MAANENWLKSLNKYFRSGSFGFSEFQIISFGFVREVKFEQKVFGFRSFGLNSFSDQLWFGCTIRRQTLHSNSTATWLSEILDKPDHRTKQTGLRDAEVCL